MGSTLYDLTGDYLKLLEYAEFEEDPQVIEDTMNSIEGEIEEKADAYAAVLTQLNGQADILKGEIDRLKARRDTLTRNCDRIKNHLYNAMKAMDKQKIKTTLHTFTIAKNGGKLPVILNDGIRVEDLPDVLCRREPNMEKIRKTLEEGNTLWAHYGERGESLRIK